MFATVILLAHRFGQCKLRIRPERKSDPTAMDEGKTVMADGDDTWVGYVPEIDGAELPLYVRELEGSQALRALNGSLELIRQGFR